MGREKILVVDDEPILREMVCQILSKNYEVVTATDGKQAVELARVHKPKVILLDVLMPELNGLDICRVLRDDPATKDSWFIMVTAVHDSIQRTAAFVAGADDYVEKPFRPEELLARVNSKIRRLREDNSLPERSLGNLKLDFSNMCLKIKDEKPVKIGVIEFKILNSLMNAVGKIVTRKQITSEVWGEGADRVIDPHITSLRKKLDGSNVEIKTVYGEGYSILLVRS